MFRLTVDKDSLETLKHSWLSQSNKYVNNYVGLGKLPEDRYQCGLVDTLFCWISLEPGFDHILHLDGTEEEIHLFACPIDISDRESSLRLEFPESTPFFWALDEGGTKRLSQEECDKLGIPRLRFYHKPAATFWQPYHYSAIRQFHAARGVNPYGDEVTRDLGLLLVETELGSAETSG
ncbi:hypothetical protein B0H13DRAFT_857970, partial [Mycena leptocephala]